MYKDIDIAVEAINKKNAVSGVKFNFCWIEDYCQVWWKSENTLNADDFKTVEELLCDLAKDVEKVINEEDGEEYYIAWELSVFNDREFNETDDETETVSSYIILLQK